MQEVTERWSERTLVLRTSATRSFDAVGYTTGAAAINAVVNNFGARFGSTHPDLPNYYLQAEGLRAIPNQGPTTFIVSANYGYLEQTIDSAPNADPLSMATKYSFAYGSVSVPIVDDRYGNPITNSAGTFFQPLYSKTFATLRISALKYYPNFSISLALKYQNKLNANPVQLKSLGTIPRGCMKVNHIGPAESIILEQPKPLQVSIELEIRGPVVSGDDSDPGYDLRVLDEGYSGWWENTDKKLHTAPLSSKDATGRFSAIGSPARLNGSGVPFQNNILVGEGYAAQLPHPTPKANALDESEVPRRFNRARNACFLHFTVEDLIDLSPLLAGL